MTKSKYVQEREATEKDKSRGLARYSYALVILSLVMDFLAVQTREPTYLFIGGLLMMGAWWMAMSTVNKMRDLLNKLS